MPLVSADPVRTRLENGDILGTHCHLDFRTCDLQNYEIMDLCCFKPLSLWWFVTVTIGNLDVKLDPKGNAKCPGSVLSFCVPLTPSLLTSLHHSPHYWLQANHQRTQSHHKTFPSTPVCPVSLCKPLSTQGSYRVLPVPHLLLSLKLPFSFFFCFGFEL